VTQPQSTTRIIVGLDCTGPHNDLVLAAALDQARLASAVLSVVHAISPDAASPAAPADPAADRDRRAARQAHHRAATEDPQRHLTQSTPDHDGTAVDYSVELGDPATVLLAAAQRANLIVIGTHRTASGSPFLLGTVSQDIAVHATCPVLLIPTP
jgi:nucleotide-binding universal stress UspA family protein